MKELLKKIIFEQVDDTANTAVNSVPRYIQPEWLTCKEILIISGVRRCGKSVLLQQIRSKMSEQEYYFNFEDERLVNFTVNDFQTLQECFFELYGKQSTYYFDEIQNVKGWELFVRRLYNSGCKVFITGSNAHMLSRELGTHLTGRYISFELFPFSYVEYLQLKSVAYGKKECNTTLGRSVLLTNFKDYLKHGGFPQYLANLSREYLSSLYQSIVYRDILTRNRLTNEKEMQELLHYLASNAAKRHTYSSLGKMIGVKHPDTIKNYLSYVEHTYLITQLLKYDPSLKSQMASPKKIYFIDNAIINNIGFNATENLGMQLENAVFIELRRRRFDLFYHSDKKECDFIIRKGTTITAAYQVTLSMSTDETRKREITGLQEAMDRYNLNEGYIITLEDKETIVIDEKQILVLPAWEWMIQTSR